MLAYAVFADAPIDVGVIEVGMGGEWDSTNVADGQVAVFAPIDLDHTERLGRTVEEIARTKAGIIKPGRSVVSAAQQPEALAELERAAELSEADVSLEGRDFSVLSRTPAVGGQVVDVQGRAGRYDGLFVPLLGAHQAQNTAVAIAAVETFLGGGDAAAHRRRPGRGARRRDLARPPPGARQRPAARRRRRAQPARRDRDEPPRSPSPSR